MELYAVIGKPVAHSMSPRMFNAAFKRLGIDAHYMRFAAENVQEAFSIAGEIGLKGINVTSPFKGECAELCSKLSPEAKKIGAVNTVRFSHGKSEGFNTDIEGVKGALEANNVKANGKKALVIGAGGAGKAAALALTESGAEVTIANRTRKKASEAAEHLGCRSCGLGEKEFQESAKLADIIVSAVSTQERIVPQEALGAEKVVMEAYYAAETGLARAAKKAGCGYIGGEEWLLCQGAKSFHILTGKEAPIEEMREALCQGTEKKSNISLVGFMGAGKSKTAKAIAIASGKTLVNTDENIEKSEGKKIADIFREKGEPYFRELEKKEVARAMAMRNRVIAYGGGVVLDGKNNENLGRNSFVAWLFADRETTLQRINGNEDRPLLDSPDKEKKVSELLAQRIPLYAKSCDVMVSTKGKTVNEVAERVFYEENHSMQC